MFVMSRSVLTVVFSCVIVFAQDREQNCRVTEKGTEFRGNISTTVNGRTCQRWDTTVPHNHTIKPHRHNHCRNPGGMQPGGPWCYTTDPDTRWEYCFVPACKRRVKDCKRKACVDKNPCAGVSCYTYPEARCVPSFCHNCFKFWYDGPTRVTCKHEEQPTYSTKCIHNDKGISYLGTANHGNKGRECARWDSQTPHKHNLTGDMFVEGSLSAAENYCRNPDNKEHGPWCFTRDSDVRWEYCFLTYCDYADPDDDDDDCLSMFHGVNDFIAAPNFYPGRMMNIFVDSVLPDSSYMDYVEIYACGIGTVFIDVWNYFEYENVFRHEGSMEVNIDKLGYNFISVSHYRDGVYSHVDDVIGIHYPDSGDANAENPGGIICYEDSLFPSDDSSPKSRIVEVPIYENNMIDRLEMEPKDGIKRAINLKAHFKCAFDDDEEYPTVYGECPGKKWEQHVDKCYKFVFKKKTYQDAVSHCRKIAYGSYLLYMEDEREFIYAKANIEFMMNKRGKNVKEGDQWWTCGNITVDGDWYWNYKIYRPEDAKYRLMEYTKWHLGQPDIHNGVNKTVTLLYQNGTWAFNYEHENKKLRFICVYPRPLRYVDVDDDY